MPPSTPIPRIPGLSRLSLFWQLQLVGWIGFALLSLPLKLIAFGSLPAALIVTVYQTPLGLLVSAGLRWFYHHTDAFRKRPTGPPVLVLIGATAAGVIDTLVSLPLNNVLEIDPATNLLVPGVFFFRAAIYLIWSLAYFLTKALLTAREQAFQAAVNDERHRLELLRYQLNPDFLAKSLTTISHEIAENPAAARAMTVRLATFYLNTLRHTDEGQVTTIGDEIALVRTYLELEALRRKDSVRLAFEVDAALLPLPLPPVMLLPLAEQAIQAGGTPDHPLTVTVAAERSADGRIRLEVANSGPPASFQSRHGKASIADVRARLEHHYPGRHHFVVRHDSFTTRATISLTPA
jgi:hypothetical protein